jgi:acetyltransferase
LSKLHGVNEGEFAILVSDAWQGLGLGAELLRRVVQVGRDEKLRRLVGHILPDNHAMKHLCEKVGFKIGHDAGHPDLIAEYKF